MAKAKGIHVDFEIDATVVDKESSGDKEIYKAVIKGDERGFRKKSVLYAKGEVWTKQYQNKKLVTVDDLDSKLEITIHGIGNREDKQITLELCEYADLRALMETISIIRKKQKKIGTFGRLQVTKTTMKTKKRNKNSKS